MLLTERYVAGRTQNSLVTGLARHGADLSPATLTGTCAAAGALLAPLEDAITARSRGVVAPARRRDQLARVLPRARGTARRSGGCGSSSARIPPASSWTPPARARCWPATPGSTRQPANSSNTRGRRRRRGAAAAGRLQRLLQRVHLGRPQGRRAGEPVLLGPRPPALRAGRGRQPRPAQRTGPPPGWSGSRTCTPPTSS